MSWSTFLNWAHASFSTCADQIPGVEQARGKSGLISAPERSATASLPLLGTPGAELPPGSSCLAAAVLLAVFTGQRSRGTWRWSDTPGAARGTESLCTASLPPSTSRLPARWNRLIVTRFILHQGGRPPRWARPPARVLVRAVSKAPAAPRAGRRSSARPGTVCRGRGPARRGAAAVSALPGSGSQAAPRCCP